MIATRSSLAGVALLALMSSVGHSQAIEPVAFHRAATARPDTHPIPSVRKAADGPPTAAMLVMGVAVGTAGGLAGGYLGASMENCSEYEWFCGLAGAIVGSSIGSTIMVPVGVHAASSRATLGRKMVPSLLIGAAAWALAYPTQGYSLLVAPFVQLGAAIHQEHAAPRSVDRER